MWSKWNPSPYAASRSRRVAQSRSRKRQTHRTRAPRFARAIALLRAAWLVALSGCGPAKLDVTKDYTVDEPKIVLLDAQSKPQKITVEFESNSPITVLLIKDSEIPKDEDGSLTPTNKAMMSKAGEKSGSFTADVPENTATRVVVKSNTTSKVKLHITNK